MIVHVIAPEAAGGGAESVIAALAHAARDETLVVALNQLAAESDPPHPFPESLRRRGVRCVEIRRGRRRYLAEGRALADLLERERASVVHGHGYHGDVVAWLATRRVRVPRVSTVHGYIRRNFKEHLFNEIDRAVLRRFDAVIAVSARIRDDLAEGGLRPDRVHLIENGMAPAANTLSRAEARERLGVDATIPVCGWIGRLSVEKGPDYFLEAYVGDEVPGMALVIGDGPERTTLVASAGTEGVDLERRFRLAGFQADAATLLPAFDVLALTSRTEGTPMVILEAVAAGVPVVAFAVGGVPALLDDGAGWLVAQGDVPALRSALSHALTDRAEAAARARRAQERLRDRLSMERWMERVAAVYSAAGRRK